MGGGGGNNYTLTITQSAGGTITASVDGASVSSGGKVAPGKTVTLGHTETSSDYTFGGFKVNGNAITGNTFTMNANSTVTAEFVYDDPNATEYRLTLTQSTGGTISASVDGSPVSSGAMVDRGATVTLSHTAEADYTFGGYSLNGTPLAGSTFAMERTYTVTAVFTYGDPNATEHPITITQVSGGTITASVDGSPVSSGAMVDVGATVTLSYTLTSADWVFSSFIINGESLVDETEFEMSVPTVVSAAFIMTVPSDLPAAINSLKVYDAADSADWGVVEAPDGIRAYYVSNALNTAASGTDAGKFYEIEFATNAPFDATEGDFFIFDISADDYALLSGLQGLYPRFRAGDDLVEFEAGAVLRHAVNAIEGEANYTAGQWITVYVPVTDAAGMTVNARPENYDTVMKNTRIFMPRFAISQANIDNPPEGRIYFRNFRLGKAVASDLPYKIISFTILGDNNDIGIKEAPDGSPAYYFSPKDDENTFWNMQFALKTDAASPGLDSSGYDYFVFDLAGDDFAAMNRLTGIYSRFGKDSTYVQFGNNSAELRRSIDATGGEANYNAGDWITVRIPVSIAGGMRIHEGSTNGNNDAGDKTAAIIAGEYATVMPEIAYFRPRFQNGSAAHLGSNAPASGSKVYIRNFRLEKTVANSLPSAISDVRVDDPSSAVYGTDYGVTTLNGELAFFVSGGAMKDPNSFEIEFVLTPALDLSGADYFVYDIAVDSPEMFDSVWSGLYPRFKGAGTQVEFDGRLPFRHGALNQGVQVDYANGQRLTGGYTAGQWITVKQPLKDTSPVIADTTGQSTATGPADGGVVIQGTDNRATVYPGVTGFLPRPLVRDPYQTGGNIDPAMADEKIYFRNFRLE